MMGPDVPWSGTSGMPQDGNYDRHPPPSSLTSSILASTEVVTDGQITDFFNVPTLVWGRGSRIPRSAFRFVLYPKSPIVAVDIWGKHRGVVPA